jgi:ATP-binding cassette subfamily F protein 3
MLTVHHISKYYGPQPVLRDITFSINAGEHIGLIGSNGCGKSTLMRILAELESPDEGSVIATRPNLRIGYLAQGAEFGEAATIRSFLGVGSAADENLEAEIGRLASALSKQPDDLTLQSDYDAAVRNLSSAAGPTTAALASLGLAALEPNTLVQELSGGQKTRLMLVRVLLDEPDLLLLDEPTNHLDIGMLQWLETWLAGFRGAALIVSHDRAFLDNTVGAILELNPETQHILAYPGNYSAYLGQFLRQRDKQMAAYHDQVLEIRRMKEDIARTKEQARRVEITTTSRQPSVRRIAKKVAAKGKSREQKLQRYMQAGERVDRPKPSWQLKLEFDSPATVSQSILSAQKLAIGYAADAPMLTDLEFRICAGERIALTGPNGAGKTGLLRTVAGKLSPLGGHLKIGASVKLGYMAQEEELLDPEASALETVQRVATFSETEARNFLHYFLFRDDAPLRPTRELSYGERARLQLALLVCQGSTFLLLDEPINHLDIPSRARFEQALSSFQGTVLAAVHDRYFIERFATSVWTIRGGRVQVR